MRRRVHGAIGLSVALAAFLSLGAEASCSGSMPPKHAGEPCTRTSECETELTCTSGVCRAPSDAGASVE